MPGPLRPTGGASRDADSASRDVEEMARSRDGAPGSAVAPTAAHVVRLPRQAVAGRNEATPVRPASDAQRLAPLAVHSDSTGWRSGRVSLDPEEVARLGAARLARQVSADVWASLPYSPRQLRSLVDSLTYLRAQLAAVRAHAASSLASTAPTVERARDVQGAVGSADAAPDPASGVAR